MPLIAIRRIADARASQLLPTAIRQGFDEVTANPFPEKVQ